MRNDITGVLLAGGKSRRMGEDKRFLLVGGETLLARSLRVLRSTFAEVLVVIAQDSPAMEQTGVTVLRDLVPNCGSLGGLYTSLTKATSPFVFVVACDMPFLKPAVIDLFVNQPNTADVVIAKLDGTIHPMHARYGKGCLPSLQRMVQARQLKIQRLVDDPALSIRYILDPDVDRLDPQHRSFQNVNTPEDLLAARSMLADSNC
jgi:molybdopterin-guanine dinucleotide biosynthesis protein A